MYVDNAETAAEYARSWKGQRGEISYLTIAIESQEGVARGEEINGRLNIASRHRKAAAVLRRARLDARVRRGETNAKASERIV